MIATNPQEIKQLLSLSDTLPAVRQMLGEGAVLLKNENSALPISKGGKVAIFGEGQVDAYNGNLSTLTKQRGYIPFGAGSSKAYADGKLIAPLNAMREAEQSGALYIYEPLSKEYEKNVDYVPSAEMIAAASEFADTAVVFISRWVGECRDMAEEAWELSEAEKELLSNVSTAFRKVVVILNTGGPIDTTWAHGEMNGIDIDALLFIGYGGMIGGYAVSDILTGAICPSGKLATTFARKLSDYPSHGHYGGTTVDYAEDIYLGYRYFDTFAPDRVSFGFGFGLSYTSFETSILSFDRAGDKINIRAQVKNVGEYAGKEVLQVYFSAPSTQRGNGRLPAAAHELCCFKKTEMLAPGENAEVTLSFSVSAMRQYDENGDTGYESAFVLEAGEYPIYVGNSLSDAILRRAGAVTVEKTTVVEQLSRQFVPIEIVKHSEEAEKKSDATIEGDEDYDVTVSCEQYTELGSSDEAVKPRITAFNGYLYSEKDGWKAYSDNCIEGMNAPGAYAILKFDAPAAGSYKISLRLATSTYDASYKLYYSDDNTNFSPLSISITPPNTAELSDGLSEAYSFIDLSCGRLQLREGVNYIKLEHTTGTAPSFSLIRFARINDEKQKAEQGGEIIPFDAVISGKSSLTDYVKQMTDYELAEFYVAYNGRISSEAGGSEALCAKYGHGRINMTDGPAGVREKASSWPCETMVASSWNTELVTEMGAIIGTETKQSGYDLLLAPGLNMHRYPLCGRNNEYYSEDAYLTGVLATCMVKGVQSTGTGACVKHFICNEQEKDKLESNSLMSERALRQIYLYAFEIAIKSSDPLAIMTSYNYLNGKPASASNDLLINVLRGEWGYNGMITGDWNNNKDIVDEINNGNGVRQPAAFCNIDVIYAAIDAGKISRQTLENGALYYLSAFCKKLGKNF